MVMAIRASLPSVKWAGRTLAGAPCLALEPVRPGDAFLAAALGAVVDDACFDRAAHWLISLRPGRDPVSTRREIPPARSSWTCDNGTRGVLRMLMTSRMKAPDAAPDKKMMMPKTAMTESEVIIGSPLDWRLDCGVPGCRAACFPCLLFHRLFAAFPMQLQCSSSATTVQLQCSSQCSGNAVRVQ